MKYDVVVVFLGVQAVNRGSMHAGMAIRQAGNSSVG